MREMGRLGVEESSWSARPKTRQGLLMAGYSSGVTN